MLCLLLNGEGETLEMIDLENRDPIIESLTVITLQGTSTYCIGNEGVTKIQDFSIQDSLFFN